jgi:hypothetical protein
MTPEAMRVGLVRMVPLTDQEYVLLKAKPLMQFLQDHAPPVASEVRQSYVETMGKIVQVLVWACSTQFVAVLCLIPWPLEFMAVHALAHSVVTEHCEDVLRKLVQAGATLCHQE